MPAAGVLQLRPVTATTRVAGVIGDPVDHSLSPVLHNAAFAALDLNWVYVAFPVPAGSAGTAIGGARALGLSGLSVTMPHKADAAAAVDRLSPVASRLKSINTVVRVADELVGDSTDGAGFLDALAQDQGWRPAGQRCVILGSGGASRAVCLALAEAGAAEVAVLGRRPEAVAEILALCGRPGRAASVDDVAGADLVVNATPVGMLITSLDGHTVGDELPFALDPSCLGPHQLVVDLVYRPALTPLIGAARARGARAVNGLGMLIHQAARQFSAWTGMDAPLEAMSVAAVEALAQNPG